MNNLNEEKQEFELMYNHVMRYSKNNLKTKDEIIEYLVTQCYFIDIYNDQLQNIINQIKCALGISEYKNELPF